MTFLKKNDFWIFIVFAIAAWAGFALQPSKHLNVIPAISSFDNIPSEFSGWKVDETIVPVQVSPEVQATLDRVYEKTLSRTYINAAGQRIMLSIAYGGDQSRGLQAHKPETCYTAQGFVVKPLGNASFQYQSRTLPTRKLIATHGNRVEPITYWMRVGEHIVYGGLGQTVARIQYGLNGYVPDGLLFRVSSVGNNSAEEFALQQQFVQQLLDALRETERTQLIGTVNS